MMDTNRSFCSITLLSTNTQEVLLNTTPAMGVAAFKRLYRAAHENSDEVPLEVHTDPLWAGWEGRNVHTELVHELDDEASILDNVGMDGYVFLEHAGDGCGVWVRFKFNR
jgi:hypothetical protein